MLKRKEFGRIVQITRIVYSGSGLQRGRRAEGAGRGEKGFDMALSSVIGKMSGGLCAGLASVAVAIGLACPPAVAYASELDAASYEPGELLVVCDQKPSNSFGTNAIGDAVDIVSALGGFEIEGLSRVDALLPDAGSVMKVTLAGEAPLDEVAASLEGKEGVAYVQRNFRYYAIDDPTAPDSISAAIGPMAAGRSAIETDDPSLKDQYYLYPWEESASSGSSSHGANVLEAWESVQARPDGADDAAVTIAILDTGILAGHEDLAANIDVKHMKDVYSKTAAGVISDYVGHGTHVAGIAAGVANNGVGIAGASYNASILPIKVFNNQTGENSYTDSAYLLTAYSYLRSLISSGEVSNLRVVNMSLGGYASLDSSDYALEAAIAEMRDDFGVLTVAAGGNGDDYGNAYTIGSYPSDFDEVLAVTALTREGENAKWSDYNLNKDISAPGVDLYSTYNQGTSSYKSMSGTSMASPLVSGIAGLLFAANPDLTPEQAIEAMQNTANRLDASGANYHDSTKTGSPGAIDAGAAVRYIEEHFPADSRQSLRNADIELEYDSAVYTGDELRPSVSVVMEGRKLMEGYDYKVSYSSNVEVGKAKVTVAALDRQGAGGEKEGYRGSKTVSFSICHDFSDSARFSAFAVSDRNYTGRAIEPVPSVYYDGVRLTKGVDFTLSYADNIYAGDKTASIVLTGMGSYQGTQVLSFSIVAGKLLSSSCPDATGLRSLLGESEGLLDSVSVSDAPLGAGATWVPVAVHGALSAAADEARAMFSLPRQTQLQFDSACAELSEAISSFKAERRPFDIAAASVSGVVAKTYTGKPQTQNPKVSLRGVALTRGVDYAVSYEENVDAGTATMTLAGKGDYAGRIVKRFSIGKAANPIAVSASNPGTVTYRPTSRTLACPLKVSGAQGAVTYSRVSGSSWITVDSRSGKLTMKAKAPVGSHALKLAAKAAGNGNYGFKVVSKQVKVVVVRASGSLAAKAVRAVQPVKFGKATTLSAAKVFKVSKNVSGGKVTYGKASGNAKITVSRAGKVQVRKGLKRGTYPLQVKVVSSATARYKAASTTVKFKVRVY